MGREGITAIAEWTSAATEVAMLVPMGLLWKTLLYLAETREGMTSTAAAALECRYGVREAPLYADIG